MHFLEKIIHNVGQDDTDYPVDKWDPDDCGLDGFHIDRDGIWHYQGSTIKRQSMVNLFSKLLKREKDNRYFVVSPVEKVAVTVDCYPFCVTLARQDTTAGAWLLTLNTGQVITLGAAHPLLLTDSIQKDTWLPIIKIRRNLFAACHRNVYYQLVEAAVKSQADGATTLGIWSSKQFFPLEANP